MQLQKHLCFDLAHSCTIICCWLQEYSGIDWPHPDNPSPLCWCWKGFLRDENGEEWLEILFATLGSVRPTLHHVSYKWHSNIWSIISNTFVECFRETGKETRTNPYGPRVQVEDEKGHLDPFLELDPDYLDKQEMWIYWWFKVDFILLYFYILYDNAIYEIKLLLISIRVCDIVMGTGLVNVWQG